MNFLKVSNARLQQFLPELIELRRHLHSHPELSGNEYQTAALIAGELRSYGWQVQEGVGSRAVGSRASSWRPSPEKRDISR